MGSMMNNLLPGLQGCLYRTLHVCMGERVDDGGGGCEEKNRILHLGLLMGSTLGKDCPDNICEMAERGGWLKYLACGGIGAGSR